MRWIFISLILLFMGQLFSQSISVIPKGSIITCGEDQILILDPKVPDDKKSVFWRWSFEESKNDVPAAHKVFGVDDCKPIDRNSKILFTSGGSSGILDVETRKIEFYAKGYNAHSIDTLPGGYIAMANSYNPRGNNLVLYHRSRPDEILWKDTLYSGHGVVWNRKRERLYALGYDRIVKYSLVRQSGTAFLKKEIEFETPDEGGHDMSMVNEDLLVITTDSGVFLFDLEKESFSKFKRLRDVAEVKSVNYNFETGRLVYTKGEESWWTSNIYTENPHRVIYIPGIRLYKARLVK